MLTSSLSPMPEAAPSFMVRRMFLFSKLDFGFPTAAGTPSATSSAAVEETSTQKPSLMLRFAVSVQEAKSVLKVFTISASKATVAPAAPLSSSVPLPVRYCPSSAAKGVTYASLLSSSGVCAVALMSWCAPAAASASSALPRSSKSLMARASSSVSRVCQSACSALKS